MQPPADDAAAPLTDDEELGSRRIMRRLAAEQSDNIARALAFAALVFGGLALKNLLDGYGVLAGICLLAAVISGLYARAFRYRLPRPVSDAVLVMIGIAVLSITVAERGLTGVLWAYPMILFFHLVTDRRPAQAFNVISVVLVTALIADSQGGLIAFRVAATLLIGSALVIIYTGILRQQQLQQEEQRQRVDLLLRVASIGGYERDLPDGTPVVSPRLREMLGDAPADGGAGSGALSLFERIAAEDRPTVERTFAGLAAARGLPGSARQAPSLDFRLCCTDGSRRWVHVDALALIGRQGTATKLIASFIDVTPLKAAEEETRAALQRQQELNALRSRFVAMTSHEFRTPLATILSSSELLRFYSDRMADEEKTAKLGTIDEAVRRMTAMLDRILLISRAEAGMLEFSPQPLDLRGLCLAIVEEVRISHPDAKALIRLDWSGDADGGAYDEKLLRHILGNLLSNALKYSPEGGEVALTVTVSPAATLFAVRDQGIGIPPDDLPHLFDSFHRGANVGDIQGTGLGLPIVKASVELHGGRVTVESGAGRGSCFRVTLPPAGQAMP